MATAPDLALVASAADSETPDTMTDSELASLCAAHEDGAVGYYNSEIANEQAKAINYYYGIMEDVPALDGCSSVVDHSVAVMVDNGLAAILKPFVSADEVVSFDPRGPEDQDQADQATEYVNYVINCDNPGFTIFHNWVKDGLLTKLGIVKVWWEDQTEYGEQVVGADAIQLQSLRNHEHYLGEADNQDGTYSVKMQKVSPDGRVKIEGIPPEEFLISPFARSIEEAPYVSHRPSNFTRSMLVEMGVPLEIAESLPAKAGATNEESRSQARYRDEDWGSAVGTGNQVGGDKSQDTIAVIDEYLRVDYDGDGVSELRRVVRVNDVILVNEVVKDAPFAVWCPVPMPHKVYGLALADQAIEGQRVSTAVIRQTLDNLYKSNNPRPVVQDGQVNDNTWDDIGDTSPGAAIRIKNGELGWAIVPFVANQSFPMLEYIALQTEERTGVQRKGNGLNPETLKKNSPNTATQAALDENSRNERAEMIARIFAETGVKRLFKLILKLLVAHQPKERLIRLRNKWVPIDPRGWNPDMDLTISVGLGVGNKAEQIGQADSVLQTMAELQNTPFAYLIDAQKVHKALARKFTATGIKNVDEFLVDPTQVEAPAPQKSADVVKAEAQAQQQQMKLQMDQQSEMARHQLAQASAAASANLAQQQAEAKHNLEVLKAENDARLAQARADFEARLALQQSAQQAQMDMLRLQLEAAKAEHGANLAEQRVRKNRPGGDLDK